MKSFSVAGVIRFARWHRFGLGLVALAVALLAGVTVITNAIRGPSTPVVVAKIDIAPGVQVSGAEVALVKWPSELVPPDALTTLEAAVGNITVSRVAAGVPLTASSFTAAAIRDDAAAEVLVPVRIRDPEMLQLLHPGTLVTLVGVAPEGYAETLATRVRVAALPNGDNSGILGSSNTSALLIVACNRSAATAIAAAAEMTIVVIVE